MKMNIKEVAAAIRKNKRFLITAHVNLEGDALGSELALRGLIQKMGKTALVVNSDPVPSGYDFLPGIESIRKVKELNSTRKFDCLFVLDCSDFSRSGQAQLLRQRVKQTVNIDHHISNSFFADINWVEPQASCTCEMIFKLFKYFSLPLDKRAALYLYLGILTDTGSFHYSNTNFFTHQVASELLGYGILPHEVFRKVYENIPFSNMLLLGRLISEIRVSCGGKLAWLVIDQDKKIKKSTCDLGERILAVMRQIKGVELAVLFKKNLGSKDEVRVNFRSQGKIDVNALASFFGGGGHHNASGATIKGKLDEVKNLVLKKIREALSF